MILDPRLRVSRGSVYDIELAATAVFVTEAYDYPLAADEVAGEMRIRAATGDEVERFFTVGGYEQEDGIDWPGDPADTTGQDITWQRTLDDDPVAEPGCWLWNGEVILRSDGVAGPFYVHKQAARSWAFSTALGLPEGDVVEAQIVPYACAESHAPGLLRNGDGGFRHLRRFWVSPLRAAGHPETLIFPYGGGRGRA